jgi:ankyrin repeat protein
MHLHVIDNAAHPTSNRLLRTSLYRLLCLALHRELLARGASVDTTDHALNTALHWAAFAGNDSAILMLIAAGADVDAANQVQHTCT